MFVAVDTYRSAITVVTCSAITVVTCSAINVERHVLSIYNMKTAVIYCVIDLYNRTTRERI